jgi:membrane protein
MQALDILYLFVLCKFMYRYVKELLLLSYRAGQNMLANFGVETAGYLTFMILLSLFPYLVLMVSAAGLVGQGETGRHFIELFLQHLPKEAVDTLYPRIIEIISGPPHQLLTFAVLSAIWTSSSGIEGVRSMLNRAYHVKAPPKYLARRLTSIAQILILTVLIMLVLLTLVFAPIAFNYLTEFTGIVIPIKFQSFMEHYFVYFGVAALFIIVASMYYVLPNVKQTPRRVLPGAILVVGLWIAAAIGVSFYLTRIGQLTLVYGSLSGFIATLIFFYVMILIFIYGAEFNHELHLARVGQVVEAEKTTTPEPALEPAGSTEPTETPPQ